MDYGRHNASCSVFVDLWVCLLPSIISTSMDECFFGLISKFVDFLGGELDPCGDAENIEF